MQKTYTVNIRKHTVFMKNEAFFTVGYHFKNTCDCTYVSKIFTPCPTKPVIFYRAAKQC